MSAHQPSPAELARQRLRARAERISRLRRRVAAAALATFALASGAIAYDGSLGMTTSSSRQAAVTSTTTTSTNATGSASDGTTSSTAGSPGDDGSSSSSSSSQNSTSSMTTRQS